MLTKTYPLFPVCPRSLLLLGLKFNRTKEQIQLQNIKQNKINGTLKQARTIKQYGLS